MTDLRIPQDVAIRALGASDLASLREWYSGERDDSFRRNLERQRNGEIVYLVATLDGEAVGHLGVDLVRVRGAAWLWQFAIREHLQSQGIGSEMVRRAEVAALDNGFRVAEIAAELTNPRARALYERLGYVLRGIE
ncbi:MAG: GNAT family N-acetyltransferase, partial [Candidatus Binatia bacterium]